MVAVCAVGLFAGCYKSPVINIPPPPAPRFYVSNFTNHNIQVLTQPITPASTSAFSLTSPQNLDGMAVDGAGNLYAIGTTTIFIFAPTVGASSTPTACGPVAGALGFRGAAIDRSGNLWVADAVGRQLMEFTLPLSCAPAPAPVRTIQSLSFSFPFSMAFDLGNHILVGDDCAAGCVFAFNIPSALGVSVLVPVASFGADHTTSIAVDVHNTLYAGDAVNSKINAFRPPFATGITSAFSIAPPVYNDAACVPPAPFLCESLIQPIDLLFDSSGNLYVTYNTDTSILHSGGVAIFGPPLSGGSTPTFILRGVSAGFTDPAGIAIAP